MGHEMGRGERGAERGDGAPPIQKMSLADDAIDRAVAELVACDAPADLRARVLARIGEAPASRERAVPRRRPFAALAWAASAAAVVLAAALWLRPSPPARPAEAALAGVRPIVEIAAAPVAPAPRDDLSPQPAPVERRANLVRATSLEPAGTNPFRRCRWSSRSPRRR